MTFRVRQLGTMIKVYALRCHVSSLRISSAMHRTRPVCVHRSLRIDAQAALYYIHCAGVVPSLLHGMFDG